MAINIINSNHSFVRFNEDTPNPDCIWGDINYCLPVYAESDVNFQFIVTGTESEIEGLCRQDATEVLVELVPGCEDEALISFEDTPQRFRLSSTQILYNWENGFPGWPGPIADRECFKIRVTIFEGVYDIPHTFCSNCFERITEPCFTSVIDFTNEDDAFGYKYCYGGAVDAEPVSCEPTIYQFTNVGTFDIAYTAMLRAKYGDVPVIQTWIYDPSGVLTNMNIQATFDAYPPSHLLFDFGGPASGIIVLR